MKIAIISDSHDNETQVKDVVKLFNTKVKPDAVIHCGDLISPFMVKALNALKCPVYICFGYQDVIMGMQYMNTKANHVHLFTRLGEIKEEKIAFTHTPIIAKALAKTGDYKAVFHGHTHVSNKEKIGDCWLVNPGELMGRKGKPSYAIYNTKKDTVDIKNL
jgi:uncharacterized protein